MSAPAVPYERYLAAVMDYPRKPGEGAMTYVARIAELAGEIHRAAPAGDWSAPFEARLPYRDSD